MKLQPLSFSLLVKVRQIREKQSHQIWVSYLLQVIAREEMRLELLITGLRFAFVNVGDP